MTKNIPRDPVTGTTAERSAPRRAISGMSSQEIEDEIRRTRAHMTDTLNDLEERVSPARLKREFRETVNETVDGVREQYHPKVLAKRAGDNMWDTVRDNPMPALVAGLSIGYMFMKGRDEDGHHRRNQFEGRRARSRDRWDYRFEEDMYRDEVYPSRHPEFVNYPDYPEQYGSEDVGSRAKERADQLKDQASGTAQRVRQGADDAVHEARRRADETMHEAQAQAKKAGRNIRRGAQRAEHTIGDFVHDNPLMAGLVAAGVGAMVASMLPSTEFEDRRLGGYRDELMDDASDMAQEAKERAKHVADDAKDELKESGKHIADSAKSEARQMGDSSPSERKGSERTDRVSADRTSSERTTSGGAPREGGKVTGDSSKTW